MLQKIKVEKGEKKRSTVLTTTTAPVIGGVGQMMEKSRRPTLSRE